MHGTGTFTFANGEVYSGEWNNSYIQGKGVYKWTNGNWYIGDYQNGLKEGFGELYSDIQYCGFWEKGRCDGVGVEITQDGEVLQGVWKMGNLTLQDHTISHPKIDMFLVAQKILRSDRRMCRFLNDFSGVEISQILLDAVEMRKLRYLDCLFSRNKLQIDWIHWDLSLIHI